MSLLEKAIEVTNDLATATARQAQRGKLELELRRLESKRTAAKAAIGGILLPMLRSGELRPTGADVDEHLAAITTLEEKAAAVRSEIARLKAVAKDERSNDIDASMKQIDHNAKSEAADVQAAQDAWAEAGANPAEQGGRG